MRNSLDALFEEESVKNLQGNVIRHTFDVVEEFDSPKGKFPDNLGNVGIADCNYIDSYFSASLHALLQLQRRHDPNLDMLLHDREAKLDGRLFDGQGVDFCNYAMQVAGVLRDQVRTYAAGTQEEMTAELTEATNELMDALTLSANVTNNMILHD